MTEVDPKRASLLFERFISAERNEPPDIDIDFEHQRREEVIQYIYRKYGRHRAALTAVVISYRPRSAVRDVGRALGIDLQRIDAVAKGQHWFDGRSIRAERLRENGFDPDAPVTRLWAELTHQLIGFPRHLSQHPGGFVIARDQIEQLVPVENAAMPERSVVQWDKDDLDTLGLIKVDILALGMLSALRRSLNNGYIGDARGGYILCKNGVYQLNPAVPLRSDVDEFQAFYQAGRQKSGSATVVQYEAACQLYKGPFLTEDLYVDWPIIEREQLVQAYLAMCSALAEHYLEIGDYEDAAKWANAILKENRCDEVAHQQLMRIYATAGHRSEALRQYQRCERILAEELNVSLMPETVSLFHTLLNSESSARIEQK